MLAVGRQILTIYVDRASEQWIVRDGKGSLSVVPSGEIARERRELFEPTDDFELEPILGH
jgi:hypothetical protein